MVKCDLVTLQSAGREIILLPDVDSVTAALQIGISVLPVPQGEFLVMESVSLKLALWSKVLFILLK